MRKTGFLSYLSRFKGLVTPFNEYSGAVNSKAPNFGTTTPFPLYSFLCIYFPEKFKELQK